MTITKVKQTLEGVSTSWVNLRNELVLALLVLAVAISSSSSHAQLTKNLR